MQKIRKVITALKIEYHWYLVKRLKRRKAPSESAKARRINGNVNWHKLKAAELETEYEVSAGIRDYRGYYIA